MKRNEHTGRPIASTAALILGADIFTGGFCVFTGKRWHYIRVEDILAMAGSLVTQAADRFPLDDPTLRKLRAGGLPKGHKLVKRHKPIVRSGKVRK